VLLVLLALLVGEPIRWTTIFVPFIFLIQLALCAGLALLFSCLNAFFRDVTYMVEIGLIFAFYATPIFYPLDMARQHMPPIAFRIYMFNPMANLIPAYREAIGLSNMGDYSLPGLLWWPALAAIIALTAGVVVFRRNAPILSDNL
jgi:ABC-type polysaccharide/polyol phosphate export permease